MNTNKFKAFVKRNKFVIIESCVLATVSVVTYTAVCGHFGYTMNKPHHYDDVYFYVKTPAGKMLRAQKFPPTA